MIPDRCCHPTAFVRPIKGRDDRVFCHSCMCDVVLHLCGRCQKRKVMRIPEMVVAGHTITRVDRQSSESATCLPCLTEMIFAETLPAWLTIKSRQVEEVADEAEQPRASITTLADLRL